MPCITLIVVANSQQVTYYENDGADDGLHKIKTEDQPLLVPHNLSDESFGEAEPLDQHSRMGETPVTDPQDMQKQEFFNEVAETLDRLASENSYDRFILVLPPQSMEMLRLAMSDEALHKVSAELGEDLTGEDEASLPAFLEEVLAMQPPGLSKQALLENA
jgi:protein required for attachment to host cells